jgi:glyoxylase I family protein
LRRRTYDTRITSRLSFAPVFVLSLTTDIGERTWIMAQDKDLAEVETLERRLLDPGVRSSRSSLDELIADEFVEFGRSGKVWTKAAIIEALAQEEDINIEIDSLRSRKIGGNVVLVTYRSRRIGAVRSADALRSSVWQLQQGRWRIVFHQGTPTAA